jgi:hypothetical protein
MDRLVAYQKPQEQTAQVQTFQDASDAAYWSKPVSTVFQVGRPEGSAVQSFQHPARFAEERNQALDLLVVAVVAAVVEVGAAFAAVAAVEAVGAAGVAVAVPDHQGRNLTIAEAVADTCPGLEDLLDFDIRPAT